LVKIRKSHVVVELGSSMSCYFAANFTGRWSRRVDKHIFGRSSAIQFNVPRNYSGGFASGEAACSAGPDRLRLQDQLFAGRSEGLVVSARLGEAEGHDNRYTTMTLGHPIVGRLSRAIARENVEPGSPPSVN
jgi:hypothetical protein